MVEKEMIEFEITTQDSGSFSTVPVGRVPGGYRLQINYNDSVTFTGTSDSGHGSEKVHGKVLAGTDWVLLRDDGVAVFDAHITFKADKPAPHVFDAVLSGQVDLTQVRWVAPIGSPNDVNRLEGELNVALPIQFETSVAAPEGASAEIVEAAKNRAPFADLAKHQFLAQGTFYISKGEIKSARLAIVPAAKQAKTLISQVAQISRLTGELKSARASGRASKNGESSAEELEDIFEHLARRATREVWPDIRSVFTPKIVQGLAVKAGLKMKQDYASGLHEMSWEQAEPTIQELSRGIAKYYEASIVPRAAGVPS
jgi:hypothetical protein